MSYSPLFRIKENGYFGFINSGGEIAVEPQFLEVGEFREGLPMPV
ncbi:MAG: WG repeat-containing protein [Bacteroidota bacterium]